MEGEPLQEGGLREAAAQMARLLREPLGLESPGKAPLEAEPLQGESLHTQ